MGEQRSADYGLPVFICRRPFLIPCFPYTSLSFLEMIEDENPINYTVNGQGEEDADERFYRRLVTMSGFCLKEK